MSWHCSILYVCWSSACRVVNVLDPEGILQISAGRLLLRWCFLHLHQLASCLPSDFCFFSVCTNILVSSGFRWFSRLLWEVKTSQCKQHGQNVLFHTAQHPPFDYRLCPDLLLENISFNLILLFVFCFDMDLVVLQIHVTHYLRHGFFFIVCPLMCLMFFNLWNINFIVTAAYQGSICLQTTNKNKLRIIYQIFLLITSELIWPLHYREENIPVNVWLYNFENLQVLFSLTFLIYL